MDSENATPEKSEEPESGSTHPTPPYGHGVSNSGASSVTRKQAPLLQTSLWSVSLLPDGLSKYLLEFLEASETANGNDGLLGVGFITGE